MMKRLKERVKSILPYPLHFYFQKKRRAAFTRAARRDVVQFDLASNAYLEVYWKIFGVGQGPAVILYIEGEEVLKFDCYGKAGHYHIQLLESTAPSRLALHMKETDVAEQIDRAIFELDRNLAWYLERHPLKSVRKTKIERSRLSTVLPQVKILLHQYHDQVLKVADSPHKTAHALSTV